ncbi:NAD(P)H-dependent glycerol-3-phosphate dehydrogenase [Eubacteriales bacterium KG127]
MKIGVIGAGSFGTALSQTFACKGHEINLYARGKEQRINLRATRENKRYLPGVVLVDNVRIPETVGEVIDEAEILIMAVPTQSFRASYKEVSSYFRSKESMPIVVNVAKGIEIGTNMLLSAVAEEVYPGTKFAIISGPSHAEEVGRFKPTTLAVASKDMNTSIFIQNALMTDRLRIYTNEDLTGVELGGALKNIIALGAGISDGIGFGDNARAALITRGLVEITRLGLRLGAKSETFSGLTGLGDLIVTCDSLHSRNRKCGILLGEGKSVEEATNEIGMVVESITTTEAAYLLAKSSNVEMPITEAIYGVIKGQFTAIDAVDILMGRDNKNE